MKRTPIRKVSKGKISTLKRKLWAVFSKYIQLRDKNVCFTCGRKSDGQGMHAGHFISKQIGGIALYFNEENVHAQCYHCNINLGGNQWEFGQRLGKAKVKELYDIKNKVSQKWSEQDYLTRIELYTKKLSTLQN